MPNNVDIFGGIIAMIALWTFTYAMFFQIIPAVDEWEKANAYPFGYHCQVWNTCDFVKMKGTK